MSDITVEVIGVVPLKGDPCACSWREKKEGETIFENKAFHLSFGAIQIVKKDGTVIPKGWGLNLVNHKSTPDRAYVFNYCPWCGGKLHD